MNFKIESVSELTTAYDIEKQPYYCFCKEGYWVDATCLEDKRKFKTFVPKSEIEDMEKLKGRLKRQYEKDVTYTLAKAKMDAQEKAIRDTLTGVIIDP